MITTLTLPQVSGTIHEHSEPLVMRCNPRGVQGLTFFGCLGLAGIFFFCLDFRKGAMIPLLFALLVSCSPEIHLQPAQGILERHWRLLGVLTLWRSRLQMSAFRAVFLGRRETEQGRMWEVGLRRASGRKLYVSFLAAKRGGDCPAAMAVAQKLAEVSGLPLQDETQNR